MKVGKLISCSSWYYVFLVVKSDHCINFCCFKHVPTNNYYFECIWSFLGCLVTGLVREFLEYFDLDFTIAVFDPESNFVSQATFLHIHLIHCFQSSNTHWTWSCYKGPVSTFTFTFVKPDIFTLVNLSLLKWVAQGVTEIV